MLYLLKPCQVSGSSRWQRQDGELSASGCRLRVRIFTRQRRDDCWAEIPDMVDMDFQLSEYQGVGNATHPTADNTFV